MDFRFTTEYPASRLDEIVSYLMGPRLWIPQNDYPDFLDWAERTHKELKRENKRAMLALAGKEIAGITVYQRHKKDADALEIKNITVRPDVRGRFIASFLLRNTEIEGAQDFGSNSVVCDAKEKNLSIRSFLIKNRYLPSASQDLYELGSGKDIIYRKQLIKLPAVKNLLY